MLVRTGPGPAVEIFHDAERPCGRVSPHAVAKGKFARRLLVMPSRTSCAHARHVPRICFGVALGVGRRDPRPPHPGAVGGDSYGMDGTRMPANGRQATIARQESAFSALGRALARHGPRP